MSNAAYEAMCRALEIDKQEREKERELIRAQVDALDPRIKSLESRLATLETHVSNFTSAANAGEQQFDPGNLRTSGGIGHGPVPGCKPPHA